MSSSSSSTTGDGEASMAEPTAEACVTPKATRQDKIDSEGGEPNTAMVNEEPEDEDLEETYNDDEEEEEGEEDKHTFIEAKCGTVHYGDQISAVDGGEEEGHHHQRHHNRFHLGRGSQRSGAKRCRASTAKERISKIPPCAAGKRSSIYRGVTRHRWTGRYEAHLWDKSTWNQNQNKKGKQVYLGAYDDEEAAAHAYDLAALKYWGPATLINFPVSDYARDIDEMQSLSREDYLASLRRKSSGFSRGGLKMRGSRHHYERWDMPQSGHSFASSLPQLNTYGTFGETRSSSVSGDAATIINLCHFMNWLQPHNLAVEEASNMRSKPSNEAMQNDHCSMENPRGKQILSPPSMSGDDNYSSGANAEQEQKQRSSKKQWHCYEAYQPSSLERISRNQGISALSALSLSSMFTNLEERLKFGSNVVESNEEEYAESASGALAKAITMTNNYPSPSPCLSPSEEKPIRQVENQRDPLTLVPDYPTSVSEQVEYVWNDCNAFEHSPPINYNHIEMIPNMMP